LARKKGEGERFTGEKNKIKLLDRKRKGKDITGGGNTVAAMDKACQRSNVVKNNSGQ